MDTSVIIATNSTNFNGLYEVINSIFSGCPLDVEVVVASPLDIPKQFTNVTYVKETNTTGSCAAFNLAAACTKGNYILLTPDDFVMAHGWWDIIDFMKGYHYASYFNGEMAGVRVGYVPVISRELYEGTLKRYFFNPMYFHQYMDNDLALRLQQKNIKLLEYPRMLTRCRIQPDTEKMGSKDKYFRIDGMIFRRAWGHVPGLLDLCPLFSYSTLGTDEELSKIAEERWLLNPYNMSDVGANS